MNIYFMIIWFFTYSFIGYILECIVLTRENRSLVFNRGFGHGPFCIIYGFGAVGACMLLSPLADNYVKLYFASMMMATVMELITAYVMIRLFGTFWWDYSQKPFNYRGIICLESSIGWGFLGIVFFGFLNGFVYSSVGRIPEGFHKRLAIGLVLFYLVDFTYTLVKQLRSSDEEDEHVVGRLKIY